MKTRDALIDLAGDLANASGEGWMSKYSQEWTRAERRAYERNRDVDAFFRWAEAMWGERPRDDA